ncbi:hypothetical protein MNBD_CHLOROFLEXI01-3188 [hydrothermal vent metagenome]|uniref:Uncharacterized protein n=1 Tax=hydrothermal vent metagenome TaxID=652676 RepID=A0A3B0VA11_9ZZZZ
MVVAKTETVQNIGMVRYFDKLSTGFRASTFTILCHAEVLRSIPLT